MKAQAKKMMTVGQEEVLASFKAFCEAWMALDISALLALWDPQMPDVTYLPPDKDNIYVGHAAMKDYYEEVIKRRAYTVSRYEVLAPEIHVMGDTDAYGICTIDWAWKAGPHEGVTPCRISIVMRKHGSRWHFRHMHESMTWVAPT